VEAPHRSFKTSQRRLSGYLIILSCQVSAWFASSARWSQYQRHFAVFDGDNLFSITSETQLTELGVLPGHAAALLSDLMRLV